MKTIRLLVAAFLPLLTSGNAPAEPKPLPWLLAQERRMPTCELENRRVPVGTRLCSNFKVWECSASGNWVDTGKDC
jgi:hypothetical protein